MAYIGVRLYDRKIAEDAAQVNISDVADKMDWMQYRNSVDEKPINMGGRGNQWRELNLGASIISSKLYKAASCKTKYFGQDTKGISDVRLPRIFNNDRHNGKRIPTKTLDCYNDEHLMGSDDDFGSVYEWTSKLDSENLFDYELQNN